MMEVPKPEEKRKKVDNIKEVSKKSKKVEPKKEKFVDRIIRVLFGGASDDPDNEYMMKGVIDRMFLNRR